MATKRSLLIHWIESGVIPQDRIDDALDICGIIPASNSWRTFLDRLLLSTGTLATAAAVIFFFAYNWDAMGRFYKFGLVEGLILIALVAYWKLGPEQLPGKAALTLASLLVGVLLALFGQTYQTGADPWQLFANWALLILPWVILARLAALWPVWITLLNLALALYFSTFNGIFGVLLSQQAQLYSIFALNTTALLTWETGAQRFTWLAERWAVRLIAIAAGSIITILALQAIFDWYDSSALILLIYPLCIAGLYIVYRHLIPDLFMLAGVALSIIVVTTALLARILLDGGDAGGFLLIALAVIGMSAIAAFWLKRLHREFES